MQRNDSMFHKCYWESLRCCTFSLFGLQWRNSVVFPRKACDITVVLHNMCISNRIHFQGPKPRVHEFVYLNERRENIYRFRQIFKFVFSTSSERIWISVSEKLCIHVNVQCDFYWIDWIQFAFTFLINQLCLIIIISL